MLPTTRIKRFEAEIKAISSLYLRYFGCLVFSTII